MTPFSGSPFYNINKIPLEKFTGWFNDLFCELNKIQNKKIKIFVGSVKVKQFNQTLFIRG
jgi:hypothetical protein